MGLSHQSTVAAIQRLLPSCVKIKCYLNDTLFKELTEPFIFKKIENVSSINPTYRRQKASAF